MKRRVVILHYLIRWCFYLICSKAVPIACPCCKQSHGMRPKTMTDAYNRSWKRIFTQDGGWYFILSPRVQCRLCEKTKKSAGRPKRQDQNNNVNQWSWPCISEVIVNALPEQQRRVFPAVLSRQQGIDKNFLDMARALFNCKVRPEDLANVWLELTSIQYTNNFIDAELKAKNQIAIGTEPHPIMSDFGDPEGYGGKAPSGKYLSRLYLDHHKEIRSHLEAFIKRRPLGDSISLDVSYKAGRHIMRHKGKSCRRRDYKRQINFRLYLNPNRYPTIIPNPDHVLKVSG